MMSRKGAHSQEGANYARLEMASDFAGAMDIDEPEFDADEIPIVRYALLSSATCPTTSLVTIS